MGITGTGTEYNIPVVQMKLVSVTRFSPSLDPDTLCAYLTERLGKMVTCPKIDSTHNRFKPTTLGTGDLCTQYF